MAEETNTSEEDVPLTTEEMEEIGNLQRMGIIPTAEENLTIPNFFNKVRLSKGDTMLKVSNLDSIELNSVRELNSGKQYSNIMGMDLVAQYFDGGTQSILKSADSKDGFLLNTLVTTKRDIKLRKGQRKTNPSWFKKKEPEGSDELG